MKPAARQPVQMPAAFGQWLVRGNKLVCRQPGQTVTVKAPGALLEEVAATCDGSMRWPDVVARLGRQWSEPVVEAFLGDLAANKVLVEGPQLWAHWGQLAQQAGVTPASPEEILQLPRRADSRLLRGEGRWHAEVAKGHHPLAAMLSRRESTRTFEDASIAAEALYSVLWAAHGVTRPFDDEPGNWHRTVASGGDMHSVRWFTAVLRELPAQQAGQAAVAPGVYEVRFHREGGTSLQRLTAAPAQAWHCLGDPRVLQFASALVLPVYDVAHPARKYGNRATLFAAIEAGQCMQNAQLMAAEFGAAGSLRGDTVAHAVIDLAGLQQGAQAHWLPMPALVLGARPSAAQRQAQQIDRWLHFGANVGVDESRRGEAFAFTARPVERRAALSFATGGRSDSPRLAVAKAEAEAWERLGWAQPADLVEARMTELSAAIAPNDIVAYSVRQYANPDFPFRSFSPRGRRLWKEAVDTDSGASCFVLADCVHPSHALPLPYRKAPHTGTSTSGMAAGRSQQDALERATLELIERDAFACAWLRGTAPPAIDTRTLPRAAAQRVRALQALGMRVLVQDVSTHWATVVCIFAQDEQLPFVAITAAAHFSAEQALHKALDEAEGRVLHARNFPIPPAGTGNPLRDIERYYRQARNTHRSDFFADGAKALPFKALGIDAARDWEQLRSRMRAERARLLCVDTTPPQAALEQGRTPLRVVRAIVPGLVPIWFGRGNQPAGMPRFIQAARHAGGRPKSFFTHPFT